MMRYWYLLLVLLTGCSSQQGIEAFIAPGVPLSLPAPQRAEPLNRQQLLIASVKGKQYQLLTALEAGQQGITLVGLMPTGARLFKVQYDRYGIHSERLLPLPGNALPPPAQVLADVMLCYWPLAEWQSRLPAGWQLVDEGDVRRLTDPAGVLVTEIRYQNWQGQREPVSLTQHRFGYRLQLENLAQ
ncbi:MAG: DUF3261 domain-containing protein [Aeromonas veronii]|uniref:DUF3261 domain-containing protein n=1 Tax=Aeromonas veronii TaxID=654 RepID=UPI0038D26DD0